MEQQHLECPVRSVEGSLEAGKVQGIVPLVERCQKKTPHCKGKAPEHHGLKHTMFGGNMLVFPGGYTPEN